MIRYSEKSILTRRLLAGMASVMLAGTLLAQTPAPPNSPQGPPPQILSAQQLDNLVAPIALYPDPLLSQLLVATTYPLEVVQAQQWLEQNGGLSGQALMDAARQQGWDASVTALVAMPDVLARLNQDVRWTTDIGNAFLAQQGDVMAAVQRLRVRAQQNGKLKSTPQQVVTDETQGGQTAVQIEPANPEVIYVPYYDPAYVWGPPAWGDYPYFPVSVYGYGFWPGINVGLCFGGWGGWGGWGWGPNWFGRSVFVNAGFFNRFGFRGFGGFGFHGAGRVAWAHDPGHRLGIAYPNRALSGRFGAASMASRANMMQRSSSFAGNRGTEGGFRGSGFQSGGARGFNGGGAAGHGFNGAAAAPRSFGSGGANRSFSAPQGFSGGGAPRGFSGGGAPRGFSGGAPQGFSGAPRSFGGGGGAPRGFGGGGFGGGAPRGFGGGGGGFHGGGGGGGFHGGGGGGHGGHR
jgi:hypothetical protein